MARVTTRAPYSARCSYSAKQLCLVSSVTFPFIRSYRIESYFSVPVRPVMCERHGNGNGNGVTERQYGHGLPKRLRKRIRDERENAGNQALVSGVRTREKMSCVCF